LSSVPLVLVADDDEDLLTLVQVTLEKAGLAVSSVGDGEAALRSALERPPQLAVLDVAMPGLDGLQLTRRLRANQRTRAIPILLVSARAQEDDVQLGFAAGASSYLPKPFTPAQLVSRVEELLARRESQPTAEPAPAARSEQGGELPLVVNADDDEDIQLLIKLVLEAAGYRVVCVSTGEALLEVARAAFPALFLLDLKLPDLHGLELVRVLRQDERLCRVPVILLTGSASEEDEARAAELGVQGYLRKPFAPPQLLTVIHSAVPHGCGAERG
jgi:DNA-binding response OmpR family regulator